MAKRVDENQKDITKAFREGGASVLILSSVGKGCPDLCIGFNGLNYLIEVKNEHKPPSARKLTEHEQLFFDKWKGQVMVIKSVDEAVFFLRDRLYGE